MGMENVYAAMLLHKAGKPINEESLTAVLTAAGVTADAVQIKALVASLSEVNIDEALKAAPTMMSAAPVAAAGTPAAESKPAAAPPEDKKKKEEEEKKKEEAALEGLGALFG